MRGRLASGTGDVASKRPTDERVGVPSPLCGLPGWSRFSVDGFTRVEAHGAFGFLWPAGRQAPSESRTLPGTMPQRDRETERVEQQREEQRQREERAREDRSGKLERDREDEESRRTREGR